MIETSTSIEIDRPAADVFAFVAEFPNNPRWQRGQRSCEWTSEPPLRVGSTYDRARALPRPRPRERVPRDRARARPARDVHEHDRDVPAHRSPRTVEPVEAGRSRFTEHVRGEPGGFFRLAEPLLRPLVKASINATSRG